MIKPEHSAVPLTLHFAETDVDNLYQESLAHFQNGEWQKASAGFEQVLQLRPDHAEAKNLLEETRLKASLEQQKPKPKRILFRGRTKAIAMAVPAVAAVLLLGLGIRWAYARWVVPTQASREEKLRLAQEVEQAYKYLAEQDYAAAIAAFGNLLVTDPNNEELQKALAEAQRKDALAESYAQAQQAITRKDWDEASRLLAAIIAQEPAYRDVQTQQAFVAEQQKLRAQLEAAEKAYLAGDWQQAIALYEALRKWDAEYEKQTVTLHLFQSYLTLGTYLIDSSEGRSEAVREALELYQQALALQPQDAQVLRAVTLAAKYLEGQTWLAQGNAAQALVVLQWVYKQEPNYANGNIVRLVRAAGGEVPAPTPIVVRIETAPTAATSAVAGDFQQQYADAMQKGDAALAAEDYAQAEQYYAQAMSLGIHGGYDSARWLFAAYAKAGTTAARKGDYDRAVEQIKTAISIITRSAVALPAESYADYVAQGDEHVQRKDYPQAMAEYSKALQILSQKCNCGLEKWSILP